MNLNVPAIAKKSYDELKDKPEYSGIVPLVLKELSSIPDELEQARIIHRLVDEFNTEAFAHPLVQQFSPCKKSCTACCHTQVSVTSSEAKLLVEKIRNGAEYNSERLQKQILTLDSTQDFYKLSHEDRKCVFLNQEGLCGVYEDRPSVCRTNAVLGNASQCDTTSGLQPTVLVKTPTSDLVIIASFIASKVNGALAHMVSKFLSTSGSSHE
jgi:uncharacterized protein